MDTAANSLPPSHIRFGSSKDQIVPKWDKFLGLCKIFFERKCTEKQSEKAANLSLFGPI